MRRGIRGPAVAWRYRMTATPQPPWTPPPAPASGMSAGRIVALVLGVLLLVPGLALLAGGGAVL